MKTLRTVNTPQYKSRKLSDSLIGKDDSEIDPSYKFFLENLSIDGGEYVLNVPNGDHGMPVSVRYEKDIPYCNVRDKNTTDFPNSSLGRSWGASKGKRIGEASGKANAGHSFSPWTSSFKRKRKTWAMDESYELFLSLVKLKDGFMVIEPEPGVTIVYEQEEDIPPGYDELRAGNSINGPKPLTSTTECGNVFHTEPSGLNACKYDQGGQLALICSGSSTFDEKLNAILNQPYDQNEYEELWRKATDRKSVSRQRQLRSASKRYVTDAIGLSYLDHYPDLAEQIDSADSDVRLSLLRKFFFWLKNLCHEGAYMPWISRSLACDPISADEYEPTPRGEQ